MAFVLAGAAGNIIDSVFYGMIFESTHPGHIASMVPWGTGYAPLLHGKVVDMLYFPLFSGTFPEWMPFVGGREFLFFRFIFNVADSAITVGVILILLFYRKTLSYSLLSKKEKAKMDMKGVGEKQEKKEINITSSGLRGQSSSDPPFSQSSTCSTSKLPFRLKVSVMHTVVRSTRIPEAIRTDR